MDETLPLKPQYDLIVIGSGAAGLTAALTAALEGLSVLVLEHLEFFGGTSARSSGTIWVPANPFQGKDRAKKDRIAAQKYLAALTHNLGDPTNWQRFLSTGPLALADLHKRAGLALTPLQDAPDYRQDCPGAETGWRALAPPAFDGRRLGPLFAKLAPPLPELMLFGGLMITRPEAASLLKADRSLRGFMLGIRLMARYAKDRLRHKRGTRLVLGNGLIGHLLNACVENGVTLRSSISVDHLLTDSGTVSGVMTKDQTRIDATRGVVLAGGGFPANPEMRAENLPHPTPTHTPASSGANGSTLKLAQNVGAALGPKGRDNAFWFPSSIAKRPDGTTAVYPHIVLDRAKPGLIAVNASGVRFVNEAVSYHEFVRAMYQGPNTPAWLICNRKFIQTYGLGLIRPRTPYLGKYIKNKYLLQAPTVAALGRRAGIAPAALQATVERFNNFALTGQDTDFGRGDNPYDRSNGDAAHDPNPCLGPIEKGPYFALPVWPTPLATSRGITTDHHARALATNGETVPGLYVCGNDMQSIFHGEYPGGGAQLGQGVTFGWLAGKHAAQNPF
ncbi:FAD-dependent oxidoreductase [Lentibacter algarum]|uniref:FAD-dependent oxidoreductase n=1 Tax=Lentibacter algarum TaxID=576131 RepID=UPI001C07726E|nr:FAD-dependent oxidoreductase [Lentibacter algarum]MBU2980200.1 FAD-dependent oxidoreductase [Lentibacter algarum]